MTPFLEIAHVWLVVTPLASYGIEEEFDFGIIISIRQDGSYIAWCITSSNVLSVATTACDTVDILAQSSGDDHAVLTGYDHKRRSRLFPLHTQTEYRSMLVEIENDSSDGCRDAAWKVPGRLGCGNPGYPQSLVAAHWYSRLSQWKESLPAASSLVEVLQRSWAARVSAAPEVLAGASLL